MKTRFTLLISFYFLVSSCSTVHTHRAFYLDSQNSSDQVTSGCPGGKGSYGEPVHLKVGNYELTAFFWYEQGFTWIGPVLVPVFPIFWHSTDIMSLGLKVVLPKQSLGNLKIDFSKWSLKLGDEVFYPTLSSKENLDGDSDTSLKLTINEQWLVYQIPKRSVPNSLEIVMNGIKVNGSDFPAQKVAFKEETRWHYVPFVFMHTEWPYTHTLPCQ